MNTQDVKKAIIIMFKYFKKNMSIVREREIYTLKDLGMKYYVWNKNFTFSNESRLDNAEEKTSEQTYRHNDRNDPRWSTQRKRLEKK